MENTENASKLLDYFFNYDYIYDVEYRRVQNYLREHSIDDSIFMIDKICDGSIICKLDDLGVIVEVKFDDRNLKWSIYQVFKLVENESKYGEVSLEPVLDEDTKMAIVLSIDQIAR